MSRYRVTLGADSVIVDTGGQASDPILVDGEVTRWQSADARHRDDWAILLAVMDIWPNEEWPEEPESSRAPIVATEAWDHLAWDLMEL